MDINMGVDKIALPVLVTGANGFLGTHLLRRFIRAGIRPRAFILAGTPVPPEWQGAVDIIYGDIADLASVQAAAEGCKTILHLAALVTDWGTRDAHRLVTLGGTENVFATAALTHARVVLVSSVAIYANHIGRGPCREENGFGVAQSPYGWAKQQQELIAQRYRGKVDYSIVRPGAIYGPGSGPWLHDVIDLLRKPLVPALVNGGKGNAGLAYVENVTDLLLIAAWHPKAVGEAFNAADELPVTWRDYFSDIAKLIGSRAPSSAPAWLAVPSAYFMGWAWRVFGVRQRPPVTREALVYVAQDNIFPQGKARQVLGYLPRVSYVEGMAAVAAYVERREAGK